MNKFDIHFRLISKEIGFILGLEAILIFLSALVSVYYQESVAKHIWISGGVTCVTGFLLSWYGYGTTVKNIAKKDSVLTVMLSWLLFCIFGSLPYYLSGAIPSVTDAFFETMSGLTTTGSSILTDVEAMPKGLLFWRSLSQWIGGLGMIVFVLAFMPLIAGGGSSHLFEDEMPGILHDRFRPRIGQTAKRLWVIYSGFTVILIILLKIGPMNTFDACCHALTTMSTGGFSTKNTGIAYWDSTYIDYVLSVFMLIGAVNFTLWYFLFKGNFEKMLKNEELRWFLSIFIIVTLIIAGGLFYVGEYSNFFQSFTTSLFHVISVLSSTGFATVDYSDWSSFFLIIISFLMIIGGCGGSSSGGIKVMRFIILCKGLFNEFSKQIHPKAIIPVRINKDAISINIVQRVFAFGFLHFSTVLSSLLIFTSMGIGFEEAWSVTISGIGNAGSGFGVFGPSGNFASMPDMAKWYYSFLMIVGRLELFTVLILFTPGFWKKL